MFKKIAKLTFLLGLMFLAQDIQAQNIGSLKDVVTPGFSFTMDLSPGYTDADVIELQRVLNADVDTVVAIDGDGSRGKETKYFGDKTKLAVIKFQEKYRDTILTPYGLTAGTGIVGKATRTKLNLLVGVFNTYDSVGSPESRGTTGGTYTPPPVTVVTPPPQPTTMSNCQFVELLIGIAVIAPADANAARAAMGCPLGSTTGIRPTADIKVNGQDGIVNITSSRDVTVSWTSSNVTSCSSPGGTINSVSGSGTFYVTQSGTFVVSCTGPYGTVTDSVAVSLSGVNATSTTASSTLKASCFANPVSANVGMPVSWIATPSGGTGVYTYSWTGTDGLFGTLQILSKTYTLSGTKTGTVTITSGGVSSTASCSASIMTSLIATSTASSTITGPADVAKLVGYGVVNNWMNIDSASLAIQLSTNKLTATDVEFLGYGTAGYYDNSSSLYPKFKTFVTNMRAQNVVTFVNLVNWNKGGGGVPENGSPSICDARYSDAWFTGLLDFFVNEVGTDRVILQAVSEWSGGRNSQCDIKAQRWNDMMASRWTGMKSTNKGGQPTTAPSGWFKEYHACESSDLGSSGSIVSTDCDEMLEFLGIGGDMRAPAATEHLEAYACQVLESGDKGFLYYGFGHTQIDANAIVTLGQVVANPDAPCGEIEEEEELVEEGDATKVSFGGSVIKVSECTPTNSFDGKLWQVKIKPCTAGEDEGYVVIREGMQPLPKAGDSVLGNYVDDGGLECTNGDGDYLGTVTGTLGIGEGAGCAGDDEEDSGGGGRDWAEAIGDTFGW